MWSGGLLPNGSWTVELAREDVVRITFVDDGNPNYDCGDQVHEVQWRLDADGLHFHVLAIRNGPPVENKALYEGRPW